ncbi:MAG: choice-of-anchor Q domain-containing protein [Myxococcota bacterium]
MKNHTYTQSLAALSLMLAFAAPRAEAATYSVNDNGDDIDLVPGDGLCETPTFTCTLRAAIMECNANGEADVIELPAGNYGLSLGGSNEDFAISGDLDIRDDLVILGAGATTTRVSAQLLTPPDRVFHVLDGVVEFSNFTIMRGSASDGGGLSNEGGDTLLVDMMLMQNSAGSQGGALFNSGSNSRLRVRDSILFSNTSSGSGGAVANRSSGILRLTRSDVRGNSAALRGGGVVNFANGDARVLRGGMRDNTAGQAGGGIANIDAELDLDKTRISANTANLGGGVYHEQDSATASIVTLLTEVDNNQAIDGAGFYVRGGEVDLITAEAHDNVASGTGGGFFIDSNNNQMELLNVAAYSNEAQNGGGVALTGRANGRSLIDKSAIYSNRAFDSGGGVFTDHPSGYLSTVVLNTTVSGNTASTLGGGLYLEAQNGTTVQLSHVTVAENRSFAQGDGVFVGNTFASYEVNHVLFSDNGTNINPQLCAGGPLKSTGYNLLEDDNACTFLSLGTDLINVGAMILALGTPLPNAPHQNAHELASTSPAIDGGAFNCVYARDQRGQNRPMPSPGDCDIGAIEMP